MDRYRIIYSRDFIRETDPDASPPPTRRIFLVRYAADFVSRDPRIDNRPKSDYGGKYVSVIAWLSLGGAVGVNARMHIQNGAPHILMLTY